MSNSSQPDTPRRVKFGTNVSALSIREDKTINNSSNAYLYHRMVDIETKIWIEAKMKAQAEGEVSNMEPMDTKHRVRFLPCAPDAHGNKAKTTRNPASEQYYHRMIEIEKKLWIQANTKPPADGEMSHEESQDAQRRVRFEDSVTFPCDKVKVERNCSGKEYYRRMIDLEKRARIEAETKAHMEAEYSDGDLRSAQLRVRFRNGVASLWKKCRSYTESCKKQYYRRMVDVETKLWTEAKDYLPAPNIREVKMEPSQITRMDLVL